MIRVSTIAVAFSLAAKLAVLCAENGVSDTRAIVEKWVETRQLIAQTKADWQADKELLAQTAELFERELGSIGEQLAKISTNNTAVAKERAAAATEKEALVAGLEALKGHLAQFETRIRSLSPAFPAPLLEKVQVQLKRIAAEPESSTVSLAERTQIVISILNEVDKFNSAITVVNEIRKDPTGAEVQVETIYLGLAQAYFVDKSGNYAGVGTPGTAGWKWESEPELAPKISQVLGIYKNSSPPEFVGLPVRLQ